MVSRMVEPVRIAHELDGMRDRIAADLLNAGSVMVHVGDLSITASEWRAIARAAARKIGRPIETVANETRAWAVLRDWPADDRERAKLDAAITNAVRSISLPAAHTIQA